MGFFTTKADKEISLKKRAVAMNVDLISYKDVMCLDRFSQPYVFRCVRADEATDEKNPEMKLYLVVDTKFSISGHNLNAGKAMSNEYRDQYYVDLIKEDRYRWVTMRDSLPLFGLELIKQTKQDVSTTITARD